MRKVKQGYRARWQDRWFTGHKTFGRITIYGANAMHWAVNIRMFGGWLCFHPRTQTFGGYWPWYCYFSPDGTPQRSGWGLGRRGMLES